MGLDGRKSEQAAGIGEGMKQGTTKRLAPKDKHTKASWKKRDEGRKGKQEAYVGKAEDTTSYIENAGQSAVIAAN